jgi:hypothetical protein
MSLCNLSLSSPFNLIEDDRFPMLLLYMDYLSFVKIFKGHYTSEIHVSTQNCQKETNIPSYFPPIHDRRGKREDIVRYF